MELKEFRALVGNDIFRMSKIISKMDLKVEITEGMTSEQVGADLIMKIVSNLHMAREDVNNFFGDLLGMKGEEFGKLSIDEYMGYVEKFKNLEGVSNFLKQAGKLMK